MVATNKKTPVLCYFVRLSERDFLHGDLLYAGDRQAMVVRVDSCSGTWTVFVYHDSRMLTKCNYARDMSKSDAMDLAMSYLTTGEIGEGKPHLMSTADEIVVAYRKYAPYKVKKLEIV